MRQYKVNNKWHNVYESDEEVPSNINVISDWKKAELGDWVIADDNCIIQVLRKGSMLKAKGKHREAYYIGTCTGTFPVNATSKMDTSKRQNIYSFSGKSEAESVLKRKNITKNEMVFVQYITAGMNPKDAYLKAFNTKNPGYANIKAGHLLKTERINTHMKKELEPVMETLGLDPEFVLKNIKEVILSSDKDDTRLKALFKLSDIMDMEDKQKTNVTQISGAVFQGFSDNALEEVKRPLELNAQKDK